MYSNFRLLSVLLLGVVAIVPRHVAAGSVNLWGIADGDTAYYEEFSDGFYRMDLYDPPPRETQQRFHLISNPSVAIGSTEFDGFPNDEDFRIGSVQYDDTDLVSGSGTADITSLSVGIGYDPANPSYMNYIRWDPQTASVLSLEGTVTIVNGVVTSIDLESTIEFQFMVLENTLITEPGTFKITGNRFDGYVQYVVPNTEGKRLIWDFAGTLTTVTLPGALIGDYNNNGAVDAADYVVWRKALGTNYDLPNRAPGITGDASPADFTAWRANFGNTAAAAASGAAHTFSVVPEPTGLSLVVAATVFLGGMLSQGRMRKEFVLTKCGTKNLAPGDSPGAKCV